MTQNTASILGAEAESLLGYQSQSIPKDQLHLPGPDIIDRIWINSDRSINVLRNLQGMLNHGRLGGTGYTSIFPVDQGIEHSAGASFALNSSYFDPASIVEFAVEAGCNAVASTLGVLAITARKYAHKIPYIVKLNHNELLSYPNQHDQVMFARVKQAFDMGATGVGATVYFGSPESRRQIQEVSKAFEMAHELGMYTILWCYLRNPAFKQDGQDHHNATDLAAQANHIGVTIKADIIKQKLTTGNGGYLAMKHGKTHPLVYEQLSSDHDIDLCRYQLANCYMGRVGLISSGGASTGDNDLRDAVRTAVINKRAGGMGLILGRKAFQRPTQEGINLINSVQNVYLDSDVTIA